MKKWLPTLALILLGLALGFVIGWLLGTGADLGLFIGVLLVTAGAITGFLIEWYIDEAHRSNRDEIEINVQANIPESIPQNEATLLAGFLKEREAEVQTLRDKLTATEKALAECRVKQESQSSVATELSTVRQQLVVAETRLAQWTEEPGELHRQLETVRLQLGDCRQKYQVQLRELEELRSFKEEIEAKPEDLTIIKGIGKVYQQKLYNVGITTLKKLAEADPKLLREILDVKNWQKTDVASWVIQAIDWIQRLS